MKKKKKASLYFSFVIASLFEDVLKILNEFNKNKELSKAFFFSMKLKFLNFIYSPIRFQSMYMNVNKAYCVKFLLWIFMEKV